MANNDIDFVQSAIDGELPAGITVTCEYDDLGGIKVTGSKENKTHQVSIPGRFLNILDSDAFIHAIRPRILDLRNALNGVRAKQGRPKAKKKAKKRAKRSKTAIVNDALKVLGEPPEGGE